MGQKVNWLFPNQSFGILLAASCSLKHVFLMFFCLLLIPPSPHTHTHRHTWGSSRLGTSSHVNDCLIRCFREVCPQSGNSDALGQLDLTVTVLDDRHFSRSLEQKKPIHAHPSRLTHLSHAAWRQVVQRTCALRSSGSTCPRLYWAKGKLLFESDR